MPEAKRVRSRDAHAEAIRLWEEGAELQMKRELTGAMRLYRRSLEVCPTAEAHTFLGWAMSWQGDIDGAIEECKRAIEVDPEFGNPYNDIGAYLIEQGDLDGAIGWLERAKLATRYEAPHFPYLNLGRVYIAKSQTTRAITEFEHALRLHPGDPVATASLAKLRTLN
jgi:Tfp pilus assembly protein PilF